MVNASLSVVISNSEPNVYTVEVKAKKANGVNIRFAHVACESSAEAIDMAGAIVTAFARKLDGGPAKEEK